ncbi:class I SAM-dependent methyltransferase [Simkania negevensis]|uniref:O-methyltransferase n=1 Tax=Simkania negevensis (strain ATCC VR-1471 / DSM 27360 / Z) TaxID=331113 RepID=F8L8R4_SIMNZ|nr:class I SAM-dependent methyltransferase [Simkania negevensis]CCB89207.1 hypothetical protein SNE_A13300 [Simkania negevensis Z]
MKSFLVLLSCLLSQALFAKELPPLIDFHRALPTWDATPHQRTLSHPENLAFNTAPEIGAFIEYLVKEFGIEIVVETGTYRGFTTAFFSTISKEVHTIEVVEEIYEETKGALKGRSNITFHLGSSDLVLKDLLPSLKSKPVLFYLDAHWYDKWPLRQELEEISKTHKDHCVIVIDDFKVPGRKDIPYDKYKKNECSIDYIYENLQKVFSDYAIHFVIPKNYTSRAKFIAYPKKWVTTTHQ